MFAETEAHAKAIDFELQKFKVTEAVAHVKYLKAYLAESLVVRGGDMPIDCPAYMTDHVKVSDAPRITAPPHPSHPLPTIPTLPTLPILPSSSWLAWTTSAWR
jgi:hypothetical protein